MSRSTSIRQVGRVRRRIVEVAKTLTERGRLMISGGEPGAMEATHLDVSLVETVDEIVDALERGATTA